MAFSFSLKARSTVIAATPGVRELALGVDDHGVFFQSAPFSFPFCTTFPLHDVRRRHVDLDGRFVGLWRARANLEER
jgi:hypothetical protein